MSKEEKHNMASCLLSFGNDVRKMEGYNIDLNKELGFTHLKPVTKPKKMSDMLKTGLIPWFSKTPIKTIIGYEDIDGLGIIEHSVLGCRPLTSEEIKELNQNKDE